jgi:hypothetical protein
LQRHSDHEAQVGFNQAVSSLDISLYGRYGEIVLFLSAKPGYRTYPPNVVGQGGI